MAEQNFPTGTLMAGKRGLIMGVANKNSIAWAIARQLAAQGAELAFTYQGDALLRRVKPLAESVGSDILCECDVTNDDVDAGRRASEIMNDGGAMVTLTYLGSERVIPNYNVMGVAKAALEASTRYMAADLGPRQIRVNAISAGPIKTLAAAGIGSGRHMFRFNKAASALQDNTDPMGVAGAALYLLSDLGLSCTGETHHVDGGFHAIGMPQEGPLRDSMPD